MRRVLILKSLVCLLFISTSFAWEALPHPGNTPSNIHVQIPGEKLIVSSQWFGVFHLDTQTETWFLPEYGPGCCNGGITVRAISSPRPGSDTLLAASSEFQTFYNNPPYIIKSSDGGLSWNKSDENLPTPGWSISDFVAYDPFHPETAIWGGGKAFLCRSMDEGESWSEMNHNFAGYPHCLSWSNNIEGLVFLGTFITNDSSGISGILRSEDHGETFEQVWSIENPEPRRTMRINRFAEDPFDPGHWLAAVYDYYTMNAQHGECLLVSNDTGRTWQLSMEGMDNVFLIEDILADPNTQGRFWATAPQEGIFRTDDGGLTWHPDVEGLGQYDNYQYLAIDPATNELFTSQYTGILYRKPSMNDPWQPVSHNPFESTYPKLSIINDRIITRNVMGIFASPAPPDWNIQQLDNQLFENYGIEDHLSIAVDENNFNRRAVTSILDWRNYKFCLHVTEDDGMTWTEWAADHVLTDYPEFIEFLNDDTLIVVGMDRGSIQLVWEDGFEMIAGPNLGYIGSFLRNGNDCLLSINGFIYQSSDRCNTMNRINTQNLIPHVEFISGNPSDDGFAIATGYSGNIIASTNGGLSWFNIPPPCEDRFGFNAVGGGFIYVVSYENRMIYAKEGIDGNWFALDENWPEGFVPIFIRANDAGIVASGSADRPDVQRLYYMPTPSSGVSGSWEALPTNYMLHAPYPNPFNAETTLSFTTPEPSHVKLTITNLNGQEVATLTDRNYPIGKHNVHWDAISLASGTYIVTMKTPSGNNLARKVQLIK